MATMFSDSLQQDRQVDVNEIVNVEEVSCQPLN
jgi:hypothetical protein